MVIAVVITSYSYVKMIGGNNRYKGAYNHTLSSEYSVMVTEGCCSDQAVF